MLRVKSAAARDLAAVAMTLVDAFEDDPLMRWLSPSRGYPERMRHLFGFMLDHALPFDSVDIVDGTDEDGARGPIGAAIWLPPGQWKVPPAAIVRGAGQVIRAGGERVPRILGRLGQVEKLHPRSPDHWYLEAIGVTRSHQGQGVGSAMLSRRTAQFDAENMPAYLECSNERNLPLYERHGFKITRKVTFRSGPPQWLMWRDPRP